LVCLPCGRPWCRSWPEMLQARSSAAGWLPPRSGVGERVPPAGRYERHRTLQTQFRPALPADTPPTIETANHRSGCRPTRDGESHADGTAPPRHYRHDQSFVWRAGSGSPGASAAVQKPASGTTRRSRTSHGGFPGHQRRHYLPHALRGTNRAAVATRAKRILTMRAYLTATGTALGLLAGWAALVPFVA
jgi:hypothetical protein